MAERRVRHNADGARYIRPARGGGHKVLRDPHLARGGELRRNQKCRIIRAVIETVNGQNVAPVAQQAPAL